MRQLALPLCYFEIKNNHVYANGERLSDVQHVWDVLDDSRYWVVDKWLACHALHGLDAWTFRNDLLAFMNLNKI